MVTDFVIMTAGEVGSVRFAVWLKDWILMAAFKFAWCYLHLVLAVQYTGWVRGVCLMVLFNVIGAHYLENIFIVNHIQEDLVPPDDIHWSNKQVMSTANWSSGSLFWTWWSGGLNHQIEHHIFPSYSIWTYPVISDVVRQTCMEFGLGYRNYKNFATAWLAMANYLRELGTDKFDAPTTVGVPAAARPMTTQAIRAAASTAVLAH